MDKKRIHGIRIIDLSLDSSAFVYIVMSMLAYNYNIQQYSLL